MNEPNRLSLSLTTIQVEEITDLISQLRSKLEPHLIALTIDERSSLPKTSDKTIPFVKKVSDYTESNPSFIPTYLNKEELKKDIKAMEDLISFYKPLSQLLTNIDDTAKLAGSEAFVSALTYYNAVKNAAKLSVPDSKTIYDDLSMRFPSGPRKKSQPTDPVN